MRKLGDKQPGTEVSVRITNNAAFRFAGNNSLQVTPVIDGQDGTPFTLTQSPVSAFAADKLHVTDITRGATDSGTDRQSIGGARAPKQYRHCGMIKKTASDRNGRWRWYLWRKNKERYF
ncbi:hypothetical protein D4M24_19240 [Escherichia coli]|nr:hypothetical protein D4M24_19240 [Escherichia coli]